MAKAKRTLQKQKIQFRPDWWDKDLTDTRQDQLKKMLRSFVQGTFGSFNQSSLCKGGNQHLYYTRNDGTELWLFKDNPSIKVDVCVAKLVNGVFLGNSSSMFKVRNGNKVIWSQGSQRLLVQEICEQVMPMLPFHMFEEAGLNLESLNIVEHGGPEWLDLGFFDIEDTKPRIRHFSGAMLFEISGKYFLFDVDRKELEKKNMNVFLSELKQSVYSIAEAYDVLKPDEVKQAERFLKRECPRQGEWFFIPVQGRFRRSRFKRYGKHYYMAAHLIAKGNRPHKVQYISEEGHVTGIVNHDGFEHRPMRLVGWHKPVGNGAVKSFKISGLVD